ncbi:plant UBX domain-containing protein 4-like isoform X2 [Hibiscus syriacus]|nr:plant UBX domain-containing protein 4-like isoform X1 [Hibiscus syriacus]XP_039070335.1 plant UBX domain-containing protein 4-like isoform X2 [Hibiscus syriacus]
MASRDKNKNPVKPSSSSHAGGIRTLADLNRPPAPDSDTDSDNPQEYYTGGEKSGMLVQDPSENNEVDEIFNQARQLGAVERPIDQLNLSSSSTSFTGTGRSLSGETVSSAPQQPRTVIHNIVFWINGFTVNDGPLRRLDDPENAHFLESIRKSECPKELETADKRSSVHVNLIRRNEEYPEPEKKRQVAFLGVGRTLGSSSMSATPDPTVSSGPLNTAPCPSPGLVVDENLPSTSIQLRLADGTRMIARFNFCNTVEDIRSFINASGPGRATNYQLQLMGFPPKLLTDPTQTVEQAGLANSVVIQKF